MCHSVADKKLVLFQTIQFSKNTGRIFEGKLQRGKSWNVINKDLENMQHRPTA